MTSIAIQNLITSTLTDYGQTAFVILTAVIGVAVAYLAFRFGYARITQTALGTFENKTGKLGGFTFTGMDASGKFVKNKEIPF